MREWPERGFTVTLPSSLFQVIALVVLVVPGISFATMRTWLKGLRTSDKTVGSRVLEAIFLSVVFDSVYGIAAVAVVAANGPVRSGLFAFEHPWAVAILAVVLFLALPAAVAYFMFANFTWTPIGLRWLFYPKLNTRFSTTPTAWDEVANHLTAGRFVRVRLPDGIWVGGWFSTRSFMSTYPENTDIYIESQYRMSPDGEFDERVEATAGVWVRVTDNSIVEWLDSSEEHEKKKA